MRATVFVSEYLICVPAIVIFLRRYSRLEGVNIWESSIALVAILMQPGTILIDHGHFQYNTVMLGFAVATLSSMIAGRPTATPYMIQKTTTKQARNPEISLLHLLLVNL